MAGWLSSADLQAEVQTVSQLSLHSTCVSHRYPLDVMAKIQEMSEGIVVEAPPTKTTMGGVMAKEKRGVTNGRYAQNTRSRNSFCAALTLKWCH